MSRELSSSLVWRMCPINGAAFIIGTLVLVLYPAAVPARPLWSEVVGLAIVPVVIGAFNDVLLRSVRRPLDRLTPMLAAIGLRHPGRRLRLRDDGRTKVLLEVPIRDQPT